MEKKLYVVTLYNREDLEDFYAEMEESGYKRELKRPLSRNTNYFLDPYQVTKLKEDPRVWDVALVEDFEFKEDGFVNRVPYNVDVDANSGTFYKGSGLTLTSQSWAIPHCAGPTTGKGVYGKDATGALTGDVTVFGDGRHVDIVVGDSPIAYDSEEWYSLDGSTNRFVQYQWFDELNQYLDDFDTTWDQASLNLIFSDNQYGGSGTIEYYTLAEQIANSINDHGYSMASIAAGKIYGWAKESNIYSLVCIGTYKSGQYIRNDLLMDYLRAFHRYKPINPETGKQNPTVFNASFSTSTPTAKRVDANGNVTYDLELSDIVAILSGPDVSNITNYNAGNPGPSGWTEAGLAADFGITFGVDSYPLYSTSLVADLEDAIDDGIIVCTSAGNTNLKIDKETGSDWNNHIAILDSDEAQGYRLFPYNKGSFPASPETSVTIVGAIGANSDLGIWDDSNYGPGVGVYAPGELIICGVARSAASFENAASYSSGGHYFYVSTGTSAATPQVSGAAALLASGSYRFTQDDLNAYLENHSIYDLLTIPTSKDGSENKMLHIENPRNESGYIDNTVGIRGDSGSVYPRKDILFG